MKKSCSISFIIILIIPLLMASTCDREDSHNYITFVNNSNMTIYVVEKSGVMDNPNDTLFVCGSIKNVLKPNSKFCFEYGVIDSWDDYFNARSYIQFMVFSEPYMIDGCTEEYLKEFTEKYQLKRYQLTKEDLERMDWVVVFPPE